MQTQNTGTKETFRIPNFHHSLLFPKSVMGKERLWAIGQAAEGSPLNFEGGIPQRRDAKPAHRTLLCRQEGKSAGERVGKRMFPD